MLSDCSSCFGFSFCFCDLSGRRIPELHTGILEAILSESGPEVCLQFDLVGGPQSRLAFHFLEKGLQYNSPFGSSLSMFPIAGLRMLAGL